MRSSVFKIIFALIVIVAIVGSYWRWDISAIHCIAKPGIMISLIMYLLSRTKGISSTFKWLTIAAALMSVVGDYFLMLENVSWAFIVGLGAFLLAHLIYVITFLKQEIEMLEVSFIRRNPWLMFVIGLYAYWMFTKIKGSAGELLIPVTFYMITISVMAILAFNRQRKVSETSFKWVATGAVFFLISDSVLAWNMFIDPVPHPSVWILSTYGLAQFLIISGLTEQIIEESGTVEV